MDFSTSDRIGEMNFRNPKNFWFGVHMFGVVDIWWVETAKGIHSESTFHRYHWFAEKHFPVSCAAGIPPFFLHWLRLVSSCWNFMDRRSASDHFTNEIIEIRCI